MHQCQSCLRVDIYVSDLMGECGRKDCNIHPMKNIHPMQKEAKMTRQEAIANSKRVGPIDAIGLVDALEALGLLKFEEENDVVYKLWAANPRWSVFKAALDQNGYKIVREVHTVRQRGSDH